MIATHHVEVVTVKFRSAEAIDFVPKILSRATVITEPSTVVLRAT